MGRSIGRRRRIRRSKDESGMRWKIYLYVEIYSPSLGSGRGGGGVRCSESSSRRGGGGGEGRERVSFPDNKQGSLGSYSPPPSFKSSHIMAHLVSKQPNCVSSTTFLAFSPLSNLLCSVPFYSLAHGAPSSSNSSLSAPPSLLN